MELDGNGAQHDFLFVIHKHGNAKTCRFGGHDIFAAQLFTKAEAGRYVVCVGVSGNGVDEGQALLIEQRGVVVHEIVNRVNQGRFFRFFIHDKIRHGPNAFVQLLKAHGSPEGADRFEV